MRKESATAEIQGPHIPTQALSVTDAPLHATRPMRYRNFEGGYLEQADGTAWMALFTQNMLELAVELASHDPIYEEMVVKFVEHFVYIAAGMNRPGTDGMWDEEDGFYYGLLRFPDGTSTRLKVRLMVELLPLCATTILEKWQREHVPRATALFQARMRQMPELLESVHPTGPGHFGVAERGIFALVNP